MDVSLLDFLCHVPGMTSNSAILWNYLTENGIGNCDLVMVIVLRA
jgi:hypothetical protein